MRLLMPLGGAACAREATLAAGARYAAPTTREEAEKAAAGALAIDAGFAGALRGAAVEARRESQDGYDRFDVALRQGRRPLWRGISVTAAVEPERIVGLRSLSGALLPFARGACRAAGGAVGDACADGVREPCAQGARQDI